MFLMAAVVIIMVCVATIPLFGSDSSATTNSGSTNVTTSGELTSALGNTEITAIYVTGNIETGTGTIGTVGTGVTLEVTEGYRLTLNGTLTNSGTLIVNGTFTNVGILSVGKIVIGSTGTLETTTDDLSNIQEVDVVSGGVLEVSDVDLLATYGVEVVSGTLVGTPTSPTGGIVYTVGNGTVINIDASKENGLIWTEDQLVIKEGGEVNYYSAAASTVNIKGAVSVDATSSITIGSNVTFNVSGSVRIADGGTITSNGTISIASTGTFDVGTSKDGITEVTAVSGATFLFTYGGHELNFLTLYGITIVSGQLVVDRIGTYGDYGMKYYVGTGTSIILVPADASRLICAGDELYIDGGSVSYQNSVSEVTVLITGKLTVTGNDSTSLIIGTKVTLEIGNSGTSYELAPSASMIVSDSEKVHINGVLKITPKGSLVLGDDVLVGGDVLCYSAISDYATISPDFSEIHIYGDFEVPVNETYEIPAGRELVIETSSSISVVGSMVINGNVTVSGELIASGTVTTSPTGRITVSATTAISTSGTAGVFIFEYDDLTAGSLYVDSVEYIGGSSNATIRVTAGQVDVSTSSTGGFETVVPAASSIIVAKGNGTSYGGTADPNTFYMSSHDILRITGTVTVNVNTESRGSIVVNEGGNLVVGDGIMLTNTNVFENSGTLNVYGTILGPLTTSGTVMVTGTGSMIESSTTGIVTTGDGVFIFVHDATGTGALLLGTAISNISYIGGQTDSVIKVNTGQLQVSTSSSGGFTTTVPLSSYVTVLHGNGLIFGSGYDSDTFYMGINDELYVNGTVVLNTDVTSNGQIFVNDGGQLINDTGKEFTVGSRGRLVNYDSIASSGNIVILGAIVNNGDAYIADNGSANITGTYSGTGYVMGSNAEVWRQAGANVISSESTSVDTSSTTNVSSSDTTVVMTSDGGELSNDFTATVTVGEDTAASVTFPSGTVLEETSMISITEVNSDSYEVKFIGVSFDTVTIALPYDILKGIPTIYFVGDHGIEEMESTIVGKFVVFTTTHNSMYEIIYGPAVVGSGTLSTSVWDDVNVQISIAFLVLVTAISLLVVTVSRRR